MDISGYLNEICSLAASGQATEHSYRPALERLFKSIDDNLTVINEPKRLVDVGAVDFVFNRRGIAFGWCEAKDLFKDIQKFKSGDYSKEQKERYKKGFPNLIYTNGTDFEFIVKGEVTGFVSIADLVPTLPARPTEFPLLEMLLKDFASQTPISINTAKQLAEMMAGKAGLIKDRIGRSLLADTEASQNTDLVGQFQAFKTHLIHDITINDFADIYAETIAYGLFAARLHDTESPDTFDRAEALELLPKSNPFLRSLFVYIAGPNLDDRLRGIIDDLCQVFKACDVPALMQDFGKWSARNDPFLHFYETFLAEYNPAKRKARGVWYTPEPVVNFIVRAVDDVLKTEFNLPRGIANTSKIQIDWDTGQNDPKTGKPVTIKKDVHRVQILDPATGTGTFLAETIKQIAAQVKHIAPAMWSSYVERDLIPRLHGFELLMASYAMCHMKLDMMLTDMGYKPSANPPRLNVFLTNSLEEGEKLEQNLFGLARDITEEGRKASEIKNDMPIMCVIGNPPYSGESANKGDWIMGLMEAYKKEPGGKERLNERNPKWINDDYVKFIRFAEHMIEKTGEGILGFITNHGYLDNPTFRGMRWHLLKTFDKIFVLDLHGNSKKKEVSPDGSPDKNIFDILPGVAIIIAVKHRTPSEQNQELAQVFYGDLWGGRAQKNDALWAGDLKALSFQFLENKPTQFPFVPRNYDVEDQYAVGFSIAELMPVNSVGVVTARDSLTIDLDKDQLWKRVKDFTISDAETLRERYALGKDARDWAVEYAKSDVAANYSQQNLIPIAYRPFDTRWTYYTGNSRGFQCYPRSSVMQNLARHKNVALVVGRQGQVVGDMPWNVGFVVEAINDFNLFYRGGGLVFACYLYPEEGTLETERRVNFDPKIYAEIKAKAGLSSPVRGGGPSQTVEGAGPSNATPDLGPPPSVAAQLPPPHNGEDLADAEITAKAGLQPSPPLGGEGRTAQPDGERGESADGRAKAHPLGMAHRSGPLSPNPSPPEGGEGSLPDELRVFDYIYGVLHSPDYRATYAQFLKIDFPRIPYPPSPEVFAHVAEKGGALRRLHLMEDAAIGATPYPFKGDGDNAVVKPAFAVSSSPSTRDGEGDRPQGGGGAPPSVAGATATSPSQVDGEEQMGRVMINPDQYFENVPAVAWEFHIGGYQPAQKWLKDRKGRALSFDDVVHYQKIIKILIETDRIMKEIKLPL